VSIPRFAVQNPVTANLIMVAIVVAGIVAGFNLRKEMFPNVDPEAIFVTVEFPGATPEEVERLVARRISFPTSTRASRPCASTWTRARTAIAF
jgi:multidrug efflux pump subunit AcrB